MRPDVRTVVRRAVANDLEAIRRAYNEGIEDRVATLDTKPKTESDMAAWWDEHDEPYAVVVAVDGDDGIVGWASLNRFSHRCAHAAIADLSVYVARTHRGRGIGYLLLSELEGRAAGKFRKIVLHALDENEAGKRLYRRCGYADVGIFHDHGELDGRLVDVIAMEKLL